MLLWGRRRPVEGMDFRGRAVYDLQSYHSLRIGGGIYERSPTLSKG